MIKPAGSLLGKATKMPLLYVAGWHWTHRRFVGFGTCPG
jgi:hypothetical protein